MSVINTIKKRFYCLFIGIFLMLMGSVAPVITPSAYAEPAENAVVRTTDEAGPINQVDLPESENPENPSEPGEGEAPAEPTPEPVPTIEIVDDQGPSCSDQLSPVGWLVCPIMKVTSSAVDSLYSVIESLLVVEPLAISSNSPVYSLWSYCLGITNILFIIFFLVVIFSQVTGVGITNYGIKRVLPKLIIAALLVNLSFHICAIAVDVSNIVGSSLRGIFESIPMQFNNVAVSSETFSLSFGEVAAAILGGAGIAFGASLAFEVGALFMLIPAILGGLVAIVSGLITIAMRQAVVILLVMISPLAIVCYMLPNTEHLFKKWKDLFTKMLVFYPLFSLLFGASHLAGWVIIINALSNGSMFMIILGLAVQVFPLFACWSLMKMSGTFLSSVNNGLRNLAAKPLAANRAWAESHKQHSYAKHLASNKSYTMSGHLTKYLANRKAARDLETKDYNDTVSARGGAYYANSHYDSKGHLNGKGAKAYDRQNRRMKYQRDALRHANNFEEGIGPLSTARTADYYKRLDDTAIAESDLLAMETSRSELIQYNNAVSRHERFENAITAHINRANIGDAGYRPSELIGNEKQALAEGRYKSMQDIMRLQSNKEFAAHYIAADAATTLAAQNNIIKGKFEKYIDLVPPTNYVTKRIEELAKAPDSSKNIEAIIGGMRIFNNRGDTSLIEKTINELCKDEKMKLGTHASQALAGFLMFEVKDRDSTLRRFGKYINLETANMYNDLEKDAEGRVIDEGQRRHKPYVDLKEYVDGEYVDSYTDAEGVRHVNPSKKSKRGMERLLLGTSFSGAEREAFKVLDDTIKQACIINPEADEKDQKIDVEKYIKKSEKVFNSILPNIVSDQFSYLSGSEQITALAKFITKGSLADSQLSDDPTTRATQEDLLAKYQKKRVDDFIKAQVYSQISRAKSDMFIEVKDHYDDRAAEELHIYQRAFDAEQRVGDEVNLTEEEWRDRTINNEKWRKRVRSGKDEEGKLIDKYQVYQDEIKELSSTMFKKNLQKGVENSLFLNARKGNLPDAKTGLTEYLDLNNINKQTEVWNKTHPKNSNANNNHATEEEEEEDAPSTDDTLPVSTNVELEQLINSIEQLRRGFVGVQDSDESRQNFYAMLRQEIEGCSGLSDEDKYQILSGIDPGLQSVTQMAEYVNRFLRS